MVGILARLSHEYFGIYVNTVNYSLQSIIINKIW